MSGKSIAELSAASNDGATMSLLGPKKISVNHIKSRDTSQVFFDRIMQYINNSLEKNLNCILL